MKKIVLHNVKLANQLSFQTRYPKVDQHVILYTWGRQMCFIDIRMWYQKVTFSSKLRNLNCLKWYAANIFGSTCKGWSECLGLYNWMKPDNSQWKTLYNRQYHQMHYIKIYSTFQYLRNAYSLLVIPIHYQQFTYPVKLEGKAIINRASQNCLPKSPDAKIPLCTGAISHNAPLCISHDGALWDIFLLHCGICEMGHAFSGHGIHWANNWVKYSRGVTKFLQRHMVSHRCINKLIKRLTDISRHVGVPDYLETYMVLIFATISNVDAILLSEIGW